MILQFHRVIDITFVMYENLKIWKVDYSQILVINFKTNTWQILHFKTPEKNNIKLTLQAHVS
jgi:hypothetical protein